MMCLLVIIIFIGLWNISQDLRQINKTLEKFKKD